MWLEAGYGKSQKAEVFLQRPHPTDSTTMRIYSDFAIYAPPHLPAVFGVRVVSYIFSVEEVLSKVDHKHQTNLSHYREINKAMGSVLEEKTAKLNNLEWESVYTAEDCQKGTPVLVVRSKRKRSASNLVVS